MKKSVIDQVTECYSFIDDFLKLHPQWAHWRKSNNAAPKFTDAEVIAIALMQGYFGNATLKRTYELVVANCGNAFPHLIGYKQWIARLHALTPLVGRLLLESSATETTQPQPYLLDSKPIPVCHPLRHGRVRLLREDGAWFGKTKKGWFFGFKLHALVNRLGRIVGAILTPANTDDREPAVALAWSVDGGLCLADLGYRGEQLRELLLEEADLLLLTPADAQPQRALLSSIRERVETTFSQLWARFVDCVYSRSWNGLWNTIKLKMLHLNLCEAGVISA
jgi:transposase